MTVPDWTTTNLATLVFDGAAKHPDKVALVEQDQPVTYKQLADRISRMAQGLYQLGLVSGSPLHSPAVGLLMYNTLTFVVSYFALLALGVTVIPLNTRLTTGEIMTILDDAGARWLITSTDFTQVWQTLNDWPGEGLIVEGLETINSRFRGNDRKANHSQPETEVQTTGREKIIEQKAPPGKSVFSLQQIDCQQLAQTSDLDSFTCVPVSHDTVATLIYTSGTTGKPKGVMLSHSNILADAWGNCQVIEAEPEDVFITISPLFHVFGQTNILVTALMSGATVVLVKKFSPKAVLDAIERHRVTFMAAVPTMYQMMLSQLREREVPERTYDLSSLRVCHSGAAPTPEAVFHQIERVFGAPVQEGYGLSEASSIVTSNPMHGPRKPGSVGLPIPGVQVKVVDEQLKALPPGEVGELLVTGPTLMLGYFNRPEATAEVLLPDGWLRTRDMAFLDADGYVHIVDRRDDLINVGGVKVYPREVEEVLYKHPAVEAVAVIGVPSKLYHHVVKAFVVKRRGEKCSLRQLQQHCREHLAPYKVPKHIEWVTDIPKGPTGKILRKELRGN